MAEIGVKEVECPAADIAGTRSSWLDRSQWKVLRGAPSVIQADIYTVDCDGQRYLVKDFSRRPWVIRRLCTQWLLRHEAEMYREAGALGGVPQYVAQPNRDVLVIEFVEGRGTLPDNKKPQPDRTVSLEFFMHLRRIVQDMHDHGIAHGDLRRRNILVTDKGPCVIDFGTGISLHGRWGFLRRRIFRVLSRVDRRKALKLQRVYYPESLTPTEREVLGDRFILLRIGELLRRYVYRPLIKKKRWQQRFARWRGSSEMRRGHDND